MGEIKEYREVDYHFFRFMTQIPVAAVQWIKLLFILKICNKQKMLCLFNKYKRNNDFHGKRKNSFLDLINLICKFTALCQINIETYFNNKSWYFILITMKNFK